MPKVSNTFDQLLNEAKKDASGHAHGADGKFVSSGGGGGKKEKPKEKKPTKAYLRGQEKLKKMDRDDEYDQSVKKRDAEQMAKFKSLSPEQKKKFLKGESAGTFDELLGAG